MNVFLGVCLLGLSRLSCVKCDYDYCQIDQNEEVSYPNELRREEYDFIIVGGGSSGSVVASRLSENSKSNVLLLEAGGPPPIVSEIPFCKSQLNAQETEWGYYTTPQKGVFKMSEEQTLYSQYKALGGCSSHNGMVYVRGNRKDYDLWAEMGAKGWSWNDVQELFMTLENNKAHHLDKGMHGTKGPQSVSSAGYEIKLRQAYLEAAKSLGYDLVDYNGATQIGCSALQLTERDGRRCSTEKSYLRPAVNRTNLDILVYARVTKVLVEEEGNGSKRAKCVIYDHKNETNIKICARKDIVLSAGVIGSTRLLLNSGIGPKEDLQEFGIPVVEDLPVGKSFRDHVFASLSWSLKKPVAIVLSRDLTNQTIKDFKHGKGLLTSPDSMENVVFVKTKYSHPEDDRPDIQILTRSLDAYASWAFPQYAEKDVTQILVFLLQTKSRGFVKLNSTDPYDHPIFDPKYLEEKEDMLRLVEGMRIATTLISTPLFQKLGPEPIKELTPACNASDWTSDKNLECIARYRTGTGIHGCCTNKMGDPLDTTTVVDPRLRVKGVKGLRVADASIMPLSVSGNTNGPCIYL